MTKQANVAISIGMPVFNGEKYICEALDSLLAQTFSDFELIISDNASTDGTRAICEVYEQRDPRVRYVRQSENKGALANFQFVLNQAQGKFFMWAAADDRWDARWVESVHAHINIERNFAVFGDLMHINAHATELPHAANGAKLQFDGNFIRRKLAFYLAYEGFGKANLFYALYPRNALLSIDLNRYRFDYQIIFVLLDQITYKQVKGVCLYKRIHGGCEGGESESVWRSPRVLAPIRVLCRDFLTAMHYLQSADLGMRIVLLLLIPVKLLVALKSHMLRGASLLRSKLSL